VSKTDQCLLLSTKWYAALTYYLEEVIEVHTGIVARRQTLSITFMVSFIDESLRKSRVSNVNPLQSSSSRSLIQFIKTLYQHATNGYKIFYLDMCTALLCNHNTYEFEAKLLTNISFRA
jgi:glucan biosynthesis protein